MVERTGLDKNKTIGCLKIITLSYLGMRCAKTAIYLLNGCFSSDFSAHNLTVVVAFNPV